MHCVSFSDNFLTQIGSTYDFYPLPFSFLNHCNFGKIFTNTKPRYTDNSQKTAQSVIPKRQIANPRHLYLNSEIHLVWVLVGY